MGGFVTTVVAGYCAMPPPFTFPTWKRQSPPSRRSASSLWEEKGGTIYLRRHLFVVGLEAEWSSRALIPGIEGNSKRGRESLLNELPKT